MHELCDHPSLKPKIMKSGLHRLQKKNVYIIGYEHEALASLTRIIQYNIKVYTHTRSRNMFSAITRDIKQKDLSANTTSKDQVASLTPSRLSLQKGYTQIPAIVKQIIPLTFILNAKMCLYPSRLFRGFHFGCRLVDSKRSDAQSNITNHS